MYFSGNDALRAGLAGFLACSFGCAPDYDSSALEAPLRPAPKFEDVPPIPALSLASAETLGAPDGGSEKPIVNPRLPPEVIQREVRAHFGVMRRCYESGLQHDPKLQGTVRTKFVIGRDGRVSRVEDADSVLAAPKVIECVQDAFRTLVFPRPDGGIVTVVYPIIFNPGD